MKVYWLQKETVSNKASLIKERNREESVSNHRHNDRTRVYWKYTQSFSKLTRQAQQRSTSGKAPRY